MDKTAETQGKLTMTNKWFILILGCVLLKTHGKKAHPLRWVFFIMEEGVCICGIMNNFLKIKKLM